MCRSKRPKQRTTGGQLRHASGRGAKMLGAVGAKGAKIAIIMRFQAGDVVGL